jgi:hypothetical protein
MGIFGRKRTRDQAALAQAAAISAFWGWWQREGAGLTAAAIAGGDPEQVAPVLASQLHSIDPGLAWELRPGTDSEHILVLSPEGDPALRAVARRWLRAAPAADPIWSYRDARPPAADAEGTVLTIGETSLDVASAMAGARVSGASLDVAVFHPAFPDLPDDARRLAMFLLLDTVLGETAVETWIGTLDVATAQPLDAVPLIGLRAVVRELASQFTGADGEPHWAVMEGATAEGARVLASAQIPLRSATAPHLDTHLAVVVPYTDQTAEGLPGSSSLQALRDLEQHLAGRLGDAGRLVAHETHQGVRILHFYTEAGTPAAEQLRVAAQGWNQGKVRVDAAPDPGWSQVAHLRG